MTEDRILVVGAGIGGLSTAIALRQRGFDVHVVERQPSLDASVYGVGIIQPINALRALDAIGCADACLEQGFATAAWGRKFNQEGDVLGEVPGGSIPGSRFPPMNGITRPKLHHILSDRAIALGTTIAYSTTFTRLTPNPDGVDVDFDDSTTSTFSLVIGADGVRSSVRRYVLDEGIEPTPMGQSAFRMNIPREPDMDRIILQEGETGMAGIVRIGPDLAYLFMNVAAGKSYRVPEDQLRTVLKEKLACFGGIIGRVRDRYVDEAEDIVLRPEEYLIAPAPWHRGRIVLMGDAVHAITPHLGQGAAQAIEDAVVLAECLATIDSVEHAFEAYTERRYERCKLVVESSAAVGLWELNPTADFDHVALTQRVMETMAAPI
ncbi:FAD-dependent oxidoreductase [Leifsonia kafniensis]|uniref:FAD-dependent oxidoreductase n=1 Tax=Leifsonia kafniensis TaxID=475957 RepID=A0ABP7KK80_9MICO